MAINEKILTGRKFRKLIDENSRLWLKISFWTKASDVEFDDNETAETKFADMSSRITDLATSFRDGVNKIFDCLKGLGFTPATNSPDGICSAIQNVHSSRYTNGYNAGRLQGQEDVKANPSSYGVSTLPKSYALVSGYKWNYTCPTTGEYTVCVDVMADNSHQHNALGNTVTLQLGNELITVYNHHFKSSQPDIWETIGTKVGNKYTRSLAAGTIITLDVSKSYHETEADYGGAPITYADTAALIVVG